jgi:hypothetical protein
MRARARVALVSLVMSVGGLAGCGSLDKLSDTTTGWLFAPESPPAKITPGAETSEPSAEDGQSGREFLNAFANYTEISKKELDELTTQFKEA